MPELAEEHGPKPASLIEILWVMGRLGCIAFGGPVAHLAHFQKELVEKRKWVSAEAFTELIAFSQFLPGPASSQVGMCLGLIRGGFFGMLCAWFAFTLPSVLLLFAAAIGVFTLSTQSMSWLHGLLAAVVAIVADAIFKLGIKLCPDPKRLSFAIITAIFMLLFPGLWTQLLVIGCGALLGLTFLRKDTQSADALHPIPLKNPKLLIGLGSLIFVVAILLPITLSSFFTDNGALSLYAHFSKTGSLVFGGGHVVLPMLQADIVNNNWLSNEVFLAGYGLTQAVPGPIFTFSSYLGAAISQQHPSMGSPMGLTAASVFGIFLPSLAMVAGLLPLWQRLRQYTSMRSALLGVNACVLGLLVAACYNPVLTKAIDLKEPTYAIAIILGSWLLLTVWKTPAWAVVAVAAFAGYSLNLS